MSNSTFAPLIECTTLPESDIWIKEVSGTLTLSELYTLAISVTLSAAFDINTLKAKPFGVMWQNEPNAIPATKQVLHGIVTGFVSVDIASQQPTPYRNYQLTLEPAIALLRHCSNCRIFQNKTPMKIVQIILEDHRIYNIDTKRLKKTYLPLSYCCQWQETDLYFIERLLARCGIGFYFEFSEQSHNIVFFDDVASCPQLPKCNNCDVTILNTFFHLTPKSYGLKFIDLNHLCTPIYLQQITLNPEQTNPTVALNYEETYQADVPLDCAKQLSLLQQNQLRQAAKRYCGESHRSDFFPGWRVSFNRENKMIETATANLLLLKVSINVVCHNHYNKDEVQYHNQFTASNAEIPFQPIMKSKPKAVLQIAKVIGIQEQTVTANQKTQIKVQFFWVQSTVYPEQHSAWISVAMPSAGKHRGWQFIPKVDDEVIVDFLEGDIDQPIVLGTFYNKKHLPSYSIPSLNYHYGIQSRVTNPDLNKHHQIRFNTKLIESELLLQSAKHCLWQAEHVIQESFTKKTQITIQSGHYSETALQGTITYCAGQDIIFKVGNTELSITENEIKLMAAKIKFNTSDSSVILAEPDYVQAKQQWTLAKSLLNRPAQYGEGLTMNYKMIVL